MIYFYLKCHIPLNILIKIYKIDIEVMLMFLSSDKLCLLIKSWANRHRTCLNESRFG